MASQERMMAVADNPWRRRALLVLVFAAAGAIYVGVRYGATTPFPTFVGACQRLRASGLPLTSEDWFCNPVPWTQHASYLAANLLVWLTFVLPCAILAATGRRLTAFLPMLVMPFFSFTAIGVTVRWWGTEYWSGHHVPAIALNVLCIGLPVALLAAMRRGHRPRTGVDPSMLSAFISAAVLLAPTFVAVEYTGTLIGGPLAIAGNVPAWTGVLAIAVFGALLGPDRRWWPWSVAPVATLLSFGPAVATLSSATHFHIWTLFRTAVPLALVGVIWAAWRPMSVAITTRMRRSQPEIDPERALAVPLEEVERSTAAAGAKEPVGRRPLVRSGVVLNSLAIALLAVTVVIFHGDPLPAEIGVTLPTFLGVRANWQDVRTRTDLREGMSALDAYARAHGTYHGATAADGAAADPALAWTDGSTLTGDSRAPILTMVVSNHGTAARIGALSASGSAFCLQRARPGAPLTYSAASDAPGPTAEKDMLRAAFASCGESAWTRGLLATVPVESLCAGWDGRDGGYVICRMVQALGVNILANPRID